MADDVVAIPESAHAFERRPRQVHAPPPSQLMTLIQREGFGAALAEAIVWYASQQEHGTAAADVLAGRFASAVDRTIARIARRPDSGVVWPHRHGYQGNVAKAERILRDELKARRWTSTSGRGGAPALIYRDLKSLLLRRAVPTGPVQ